MSDLKGKTALVTGSARRIGRETALALAREGANVIVHYRKSGADAAELPAELAAYGVKTWVLQADFDRQEYEGLIEKAFAVWGGLDILVNNASIFPVERLEDMTWAGLTRNIEVNAWAPYVLGRDFAARAKEGGKIIHMLDSRTTGFDWTHVSYILSKHVLTALTRMTAVAYAPKVSVNGVAPGLILPPPGKDESYIDKLVHTVPLQRHGDPSEIAEAIVYLAKTDFVTGEVIFVDGGRHLKEYVQE